MLLKFLFVFEIQVKHEVENFSRHILLITNQYHSQQLLLGENVSALQWHIQRINTNKPQVPISQKKPTTFADLFVLSEGWRSVRTKEEWGTGGWVH